MDEIKKRKDEMTWMRIEKPDLIYESLQREWIEIMSFHV